MSKKTIITGATGFVGNALVKQLLVDMIMGSASLILIFMSCFTVKGGIRKCH